ncbi:flagellar hook-basal body complex protein FliE [Janthinobacterium sp. GB4P2]|uniref:flagellar hook-basal body complex protein FliE n=1 Tax=Janthinobacterium sp. GB4P2 TaxID=3424189 RepID=UPI003F1E63B6
MAIESIAAAAAIPEAMATIATPPSPAGGFGHWFSTELQAVNTRLVNADHQIQQLAVGDVENLHEVMIHLEEAKLSFQLLAQVRNHLLEAYQEVMRMQV